MKRRPLIIITSTSEIMLDGPVLAVAVTTTFPNPTPRSCVELPWYRNGHPATGFARRCAAVCNWLVSLRPSQVDEIKGYLPSRWLSLVIDRVHELNAQ